LQELKRCKITQVVKIRQYQLSLNLLI